MFMPRDIIRFEAPSKLSGFWRTGPAKKLTIAEQKRKVPKFGAKGSCARAIWLQDGWVYLIDILRDKTEIWKCSSQLLSEMHLGGQISLVEEDRSEIGRAEALSSARQLQRRDKMRAIIAPLLEQTPHVFESAYRGHAVAEREPNVDVTATTIHTALHRYWRNGMTPNALLPRFDRIGTPHKPRKISRVLGAALKENDEERRRREERGEPKRRDAVIISPELRELFDTMTNTHYRKKRTASLRFVHDQILGHLQSIARVNQKTGRVEVDGKRSEQAKKGLPTLRQYQYWYQTSGRKMQDELARIGESRYQKDRRATLGSASMGLYGIGSRFEIDSTPLDVGCVSERNRRRYVGRPHLHVVIDNFSKMIVGIYLGFQDPSWQAARLAIRNTTEDKVEFCSRYGLSISPDEWPTKDVLPARILADRGEWEKYDATDFVARTGVTVENTTPYRGDMKGTVEKRFDMFNRYLRQIVPGAVTKDHAERGDADYRRQAKLNLKELTKVVIQLVLHFNNQHRLESLHQPADMIEDGVAPLPRDMWNWAQRNGRSELKRMNHAELEFALLERGQASSSTSGLRFRGLYYYSAEMHAEDKFTKTAAVEKVEVSWDPQRTNQIWRHRTGGGYEECRLTEQSKGFADLTFKEAEQFRYDLNKANQRGRHISAKALHDIIEEVELELEAIRAHSSTNLSGKSMDDAKAEREHEKIMERLRESMRSGAAAAAYADSTNGKPNAGRRQHPYSTPG
jgi:hypothetical protein